MFSGDSGSWGCHVASMRQEPVSELSPEQIEELAVQRAVQLVEFNVIRTGDEHVLWSGTPFIRACLKFCHQHGRMKGVRARKGEEQW